MFQCIFITFNGYFSSKISMFLARSMLHKILFYIKLYSKIGSLCSWRLKFKYIKFCSQCKKVSNYQLTHMHRLFNLHKMFIICQNAITQMFVNQAFISLLPFPLSFSTTPFYGILHIIWPVTGGTSQVRKADKDWTSPWHYTVLPYLLITVKVITTLTETLHEAMYTWVEYKIILYY